MMGMKNLKVMLTRISPDIPRPSFRSFFKLESSSAILLFIAALLGMVVKNLPDVGIYEEILNFPIRVSAGSIDLNKPLILWVNDGLMAIFFLMVTLEIKREMLVGHLSSVSSVVLPGVAMVGGMVVPALVFVAFNLSLIHI